MTVFWVFDMVNGIVESLNVHSMNMCENMFVFCIVLTDPFGYLIWINSVHNASVLLKSKGFVCWQENLSRCTFVESNFLLGEFDSSAHSPNTKFNLDCHQSPGPIVSSGVPE